MILEHVWKMFGAMHGSVLEGVEVTVGRGETPHMYTSAYTNQNNWSNNNINGMEQSTIPTRIVREQVPVGFPN